MTDEKFHDLISSYFEETIDDHDLQLLNRELATSSERVKQFNDRRLMIGLVLEHGLSVETELEKEGGEQNQILPAPINESITDVMQDGGSFRWISARSSVLLLSALAASLLLICSGFHLENLTPTRFQRSRPSPTRPMPGGEMEIDHKVAMLPKVNFILRSVLLAWISRMVRPLHYKDLLNLKSFHLIKRFSAVGF